MLRMRHPAAAAVHAVMTLTLRPPYLFPSPPPRRLHLRPDTPRRADIGLPPRGPTQARRHRHSLYLAVAGLLTKAWRLYLPA